MGELITCEDFMTKKMDWYVRMWKYGRHDDDVFSRNMQLMGFNDKDIQECLDEYHNGDEKNFAVQKNA